MNTFEIDIIQDYRNRFINEVKKYKLTDILKYINVENTRLINSRVCARTIKYRIHGNDKELDLLITSWYLNDFAYYAILFSDDKGRNLKTDRDFFRLYSFAYLYIIKKDDTDSSKDKVNSGFMNYFSIIVSEQLIYQDIEKIKDNFNRDLYILDNTLPNVIEDFDLNSFDVKSSVAMWHQLAKIIYCIAGLSIFGCSVQNAVNKITKNKKENEIFLECINNYASSFEDIKRNAMGLGKSVFYAKPYVKTDKGFILSINPYLNYYLFEHCVYWAVRDYYRCKSKDKQLFTNAFGKCFEIYFEELVSEYAEGCFVKIDKSSVTKTADWQLKLNHYVFIIEQKASFIETRAKSQTPNYEVVDRYFDKVINKASNQLNSTKINVGKEHVYKTILVYDDYLYFATIPEDFTTDDNQYLFMNIDEMETLLYTYKNDHKKFLQVMELIDNNASNKPFRSIFKELEISNKVINKAKYEKYFDIMKNSNII